MPIFHISFPLFNEKSYVLNLRISKCKLDTKQKLLVIKINLATKARVIMRIKIDGKNKQHAKVIKESTTIDELVFICKISKQNEEEVRQAILRILSNDIDRLKKIQSFVRGTNEEKEISNEMKSLRALSDVLKRESLSTGFNKWKENEGAARRQLNDVSLKLIECIDNIARSSFEQRKVQEDSSISSMLMLFQKNAPIPEVELNNLNRNDNKLNDFDLNISQGLNYSNTESISSSSSNSFVDNLQTTQTFNKLQVIVNPECSKQILDSIAGKNDADFIRYNKTTNQSSSVIIPPNLNSQDLLKDLTNKMHEFEQLKHPSPPWDYKRLDPKNENEKSIIKIDFYPEKMPIGPELTKMLAEKEAYSLVVRKLSILCGTLTLLDSPSFLTENAEKKQEIRNYITALSNAIVSDAIQSEGKVDIKKDFESFINNLSADIGKLSGIKPQDINSRITDPIRRAERYFTAEYNKDMVLMAITHRNDGAKVVQMDIELNQLELQQKKEYIKIHDPHDSPQWFLDLMPAEQDWYRQRVPKILEDKQGWENFEKLFKSSAMQHAPGLSNARANFGILQHPDGAVEILTVGLQSGVPANYEMAQEEMAKHAIANIEQMRNIAIRVSGHNYQQLWGDYFGDDQPGIPILFQSLLSPETVGTKADQKLVDAQSLAMAGTSRDYDAANYSVMLHNNPTNAFRAAEALKSQLNAMKARYSEDSTRVDNNWMSMGEVRSAAKLFVNKIISKCRNNLSVEDQAILLTLTSDKQLSVDQKKSLSELIKSDKLGLTDAQKTGLLKIMVAENECKKLAVTATKNFSTDWRNKEEYKIALKRLLVEGMGGVIINNCKSGKDRTGLSEIYQHAMIHSLKKYGDISSYDAKGPSRQQFCQIIYELYSSGKIQEAAGFNTPGSAGVKAPQISGIIDNQIIQLLGDLHKKGCDIAGLNKPPQYTRLEKEQLKNKDKSNNNTADIIVTSQLKF